MLMLGALTADVHRSMNAVGITHLARVTYKGQSGTITACFPDGIAWVRLDSPSRLIAAPLSLLRPIDSP